MAFSFGVHYEAFSLFFVFHADIVSVGESLTGENIFGDKVLQIFNILAMMEFEKVLASCPAIFIDIEFFVQIEGLDERMGHGNSSGLHGVVFVVVEVADVFVVKV